MYSELNEVFDTALDDRKTINANSDGYQARIGYGVKIVNEKGLITIYNTANGGDFYREITDDEYEVFLQEGWYSGVYKMCIEKYKGILQEIERKTKKKIKGRKNLKYLDYLKKHKETILKKYYNITQKLSKL